jgi:hypothetical protein
VREREREKRKGEFFFKVDSNKLRSGIFLGFWLGFFDAYATGKEDFGL